MIVKPGGPTVLQAVLWAVPALTPLIAVPYFKESLTSHSGALPSISRVVYSSPTALSLIFFVIVFALGYIHSRLQVVALLFFLGFVALGIALPHLG